MSAPFEFSYMGDDGGIDLDKTPELGRLIDEWCTEHYGADQMVFGVLAFDDDMNIVGLLVDVYGDPNDPAEVTHEHGDDFGLPEVIAWVREQGVDNMFTFVRRTADYGHGATPGTWDAGISTAANGGATMRGLHYQGHVITDGSETSILDNAGHAHRGAGEHHGHSHNPAELRGMERGMEALMRDMTGEQKAEIGKKALERLLEMQPDLDPEIVQTIREAIAANETGARPDPDSLQRLIRTISRMGAAIYGSTTDEEMQAALRAKDGEATPPVDQPSKRPDVPPAFYN